MPVRMFADTVVLQSLMHSCAEHIYNTRGYENKDATASPKHLTLMRAAPAILVCQLISHAFIRLVGAGIRISTLHTGLQSEVLDEVYSDLFLQPDVNMYVTDIVNRVMSEYNFGSIRSLNITPVITDGVLLVFHEQEGIYEST